MHLVILRKGRTSKHDAHNAEEESSGLKSFVDE